MYIDKQALRENLIKVSSRSGLYLGAIRLDYLQQFYNGWMYFEPEKMQMWNPDYDMQKWVFMKESAAIAHSASLNAWSLLRRCYGNGQAAIDQFRALLDEIPFSCGKKLDDTVGCQIYEIYSRYHWDDDASPVDGRAIRLYYTITQNYESMIPVVERFISGTHPEIWVYLHYERYFMQARFLYYSTEKGWVENTDLYSSINYYEDLLAFHAYAALIQQENHSNHIITVHSKDGIITIDIQELEDDWNNIINYDADISICDRAPFSKTYTQWKNTVING